MSRDSVALSHEELALRPLALRAYPSPHEARRVVAAVLARLPRDRGWPLLDDHARAECARAAHNTRSNGGNR